MAEPIYSPTDISGLVLNVILVIIVIFVIALWSARFRSFIDGEEVGDITFLLWGNEEFGGLTYKWSAATSARTQNWIKDIDFGTEEQQTEFKKLIESLDKYHIYGVRDSSVQRTTGAHVGKVLVISTRDLDDGHIQDNVSGRWYWLPYPHRSTSRRVYAHPDSIDWGVQDVPDLGKCRVITLTPIGREDVRKQVVISSDIRWHLLKEIIPRTTSMANSKQIEVVANARIAEAEDAKRLIQEEMRSVADERDFLAKIVSKINNEDGSLKSMFSQVKTSYMMVLILSVMGYFVTFNYLPLYVENIEPFFAGFIGIIFLPIVFLWRRGLLRL